MALLSLPGTRNKITNPSWEQGESGWSFNKSSVNTTASYNRVSEFSWVGSYSAKLAVTTNTATSGNRVWLDTSYTIELDPGDQYWLTARAKTDNANFRPGILVVWLDAGDAPLGTIELTMHEPESLLPFHYMALEAIAPASTAKATIRVYGEFQTNSLANVNIWFDGVQFEWSERATTYCDGDQPGCIWDGTAHLSTSTRDAKFVKRGNIGRYGVIKVEPRLYLANKNNVLKNNVTDWITTGRVSLDTERDIQMTFEARIRYPDRVVAFQDFLAPFLTVVYADGTIVYNQLGLYVVLPSPKEYTYIDKVGTVTGYDMTWFLSQQAFDTTYKITVGTTYTTKMKSILDGAGITRYNIKSSSKTCQEEKTWPPGTTKLQILNDMASAINYHAFHADRGGVVKSFPFVDINKAEPAGRYRGGDNGVVLEPFTMQPALDKLCNHIVVVKESTDATPGDVIKAVRKNNNPASPTSIPSLGFEIVKVITDGEIETQQDAEALADKAMAEWSSVYVSATMRSFPEPWHNPYEVYDLALNDKNGNSIPEATGRFLCKGWRIGFSVDDAQMEHDVFRIVPYGTQVV